MTSENTKVSVLCAKFQVACQQLNDRSHRSQAEKYILSLRAEASARYVAFEILTQRSGAFSSNTKFHALNLLRDVVLQHWENLDSSERSHLRLTLLKLAVDNDFQTNCESFVHRQLLQLVAVIYKRGWLDSCQVVQGLKVSKLQSELLLRIEQLLRQSTSSIDTSLNSCMIGTDLIVEVVHQFSSSQSVAIGLSEQFHNQCKSLFNNGGALFCIFKQIGMVFSNHMKFNTYTEDAVIAKKRLKILVQLLKVMNTILTWDFQMKIHIGPTKGSGSSSFDNASRGVNASQNFTIISPPAEWRALLCSSNFIDTLLKAAVDKQALSISSYLCLRKQHFARQCLIQIASIDGPIFEEKFVEKHQRKVVHATLLLVSRSTLSSCNRL